MASDKAKTAKQAAAQVLREAGEPLKAGEIGRRVLEMEGVKLAGKTPLATIAAILATENKKADGLFERVAPGTYGLREQPTPAQPPKPSSGKQVS